MKLSISTLKLLSDYGDREAKTWFFHCSYRGWQLPTARDLIDDSWFPWLDNLD